ncbi:MAG: hypothetical protein H6822_20425 [Planctomycetaceae bacterium]|nr:hypothetical protein [Planctomycetales bacterium]MCB9924556.1 hypothetical protein [Planctomycetaceae bacterium]
MIPAPMENPFRRSHGTDRSEYRPSDHVLVLGAGRENPHATLHEFVHILEHCSTPYGFLLDELNFRQNLLIQEFLKAVDGPITVPIYNWAVTERKRVSSSATATEIFENLFKRFLQPWSICLHIVNAFEGKDNKYIRTSTIGEDATFLAVCEAVPGTATDLDAVDDVLVVELMEELSCPSISWVGDARTTSFPYGAHHISEGLAQLHEGLERCFDSQREHEYLALPFKVIDFVGKNRFAHMQKHAFVTYQVIADLARFTPAGMYYGRLRPQNSTWKDIHPGYRFELALETVAQSDAWVDDLNDAESLAQFVCEERGWTQPREFLELGASNEHLTVRRHRDACRIRLDDFMAFGQIKHATEKGSAVAAFFSDHMPMTLHPDYGTVCCFPETEHEPIIAAEHVRNLFISDTCWCAMMNGIPSLPILPAGLLLEEYTGKKTEVEFAEHLESEHPWLRRDRFVTLEGDSC